MSHRQDNWVSILAQAEFAYNNHLSSSTGQSPFFMWYGEHPEFHPGTFTEAKVPAAEDLAKLMNKTNKEAEAMIKMT